MLWLRSASKVEFSLDCFRDSKISFPLRQKKGFTGGDSEIFGKDLGICQSFLLQFSLGLCLLLVARPFVVSNVNHHLSVCLKINSLQRETLKPSFSHGRRLLRHHSQTSWTRQPLLLRYSPFTRKHASPTIIRFTVCPVSVSGYQMLAFYFHNVCIFSSLCIVLPRYGEKLQPLTLAFRWVRYPYTVREWVEDTPGGLIKFQEFVSEDCKGGEKM